MMMSLIPIAFTAAALLAPCPQCLDAETELAAGDTLAALELAEEAVRENPDDPWALGLLGTTLAMTAPTQAVDFTQRARAEELLNRAIRMDSDDPRWWYALGLLERRRLGKVDAMRYFHRAEELAAEGSGSLNPEQRSRLLTEVGRALEEHVVDFQGFIAQNDAIPIVQGMIALPIAGGTEGPIEADMDFGEACVIAFCMNFERPRWFHEILFTFETQEELVADDQRRMTRAFEEAIRHNPRNDLAARGLLGDLARREEWNDYVEAARRLVAGDPDDGWMKVFLGAGLVRLDRPEEATSVFEEALATLPEDERLFLQDITELLRDDIAAAHRERSPQEQAAFRQLYWQTMDPLLSTSPNERLLEHYTRIALAELWFTEPQLEVRGALTERGVVLIRYGRPRWIRQIRVDSDAAQAYADFFNAPGGSRTGRWILWTYSESVPSFVFTKPLGSRKAEHANLTASKELEEFARHRRPSSFRIPGFQELNHQVARFKGTQADVEADVMFEIPEAPEGREEVEAQGAFVLIPQAPGQAPVQLDTSLDLALSGGKTATFRAPVNEGAFPYSVEVVAEDRSVLAAARGELVATRFGEDGLALSDLLLARSVQPARSEPTERRHFAIAPAADLTYRVGEPVAIYFEIYGLDRNDDDVANYTVELQISGDEEGFFQGVARRLSDLLGRTEDSGVISWEGTAQGDADRVPEWFSLELPDPEPGQYQVRVRVLDRVGGREATVTRQVTFEGPPEPGPEGPGSD